MNERIRELAEQAMVPAPYEFGGTYMAFSKEKFAELIVADCLDVVAMRIYLSPVEMCRQECKALASEIKEHFGVKE
jgi:hypothetical protein